MTDGTVSSGSVEGVDGNDIDNCGRVDEEKTKDEVEVDDEDCEDCVDCEAESVDAIEETSSSRVPSTLGEGGGCGVCSC